MKIYVASSWNNKLQPDIVKILRVEDHEVYDFRENPAFDEMSLQPQDLVRPHEHHKIPEEALDRAFKKDMEALDWCDAVVLVNPCGISAHMELAYVIGKGKMGFILYHPDKPELMSRMANLGLFEDLPSLSLTLWSIR